MKRSNRERRTRSFLSPETSEQEEFRISIGNSNEDMSAMATSANRTAASSASSTSSTIASSSISTVRKRRVLICRNPAWLEPAG